jgi:glycosyltransferase involved in cell wall biosynthesis
MVVDRFRKLRIASGERRPAIGRHIDLYAFSLRSCLWLSTGEPDVTEKSMARLQSDDGGPLVSVVVPAFNAATTIGWTLDSIARQTYRRLDVVIVDDGSTDDTNSVVRRFCVNDSRMRLIEQPNSGVAAARNAGIGASKGDFVAFIDADDLWHPTKIERQLRALLEQDPDVALAYSPFRVIDGDGNVMASAKRQDASGWVLDRHLRTNIVGNGSSILVRKSVLQEFGGFDPWLRQQGAEGCEDLLLQLRIASRYKFCEVPEYLVGYRRHGRSMSADRDRMTRSGMLAIRRALAECAVPARAARGVLARYEWKRFKLAVRGGDRHEASAMLRALCRTPEILLSSLWNDLVAFTFARIRRRVERFRRNNPPRRRHFYDYSPS